MAQPNKFPSLPALPLAKAIQKQGQRRHLHELFSSAGVSDRRYREWITGNSYRVEFGTADKILLSLGLHWWDVWNEDTVKRGAFKVQMYRYAWHGRLGRKSRRRLRYCRWHDFRWYGPTSGPDFETLRVVAYAFTGEEDQLELAA